MIDTPQNIQYVGKRLNVQTVCGVSILRAGETMESALAEVCKDIRLGKILIQTNLDTGEPEVTMDLCFDMMQSPSRIVSCLLGFGCNILK